MLRLPSCHDMAAQRQAQANELWGVVKSVWEVPFTVPHGLIMRLMTLVGDGDIVYTDAAMEAAGLGVVAGSTCLLTPELVVLATIDVPEEVRGPGPVLVEAWSRARLDSIEIPPDRNVGADPWDEMPAHGWPAGAQAVLRFQGRQQPLLLPLSRDAPRERRRAFGELFPSLVKNLAT